MIPSPDRNFDDLAQRFQRNVYASLKGNIRLRVLQRDFEEYLPAHDGAAKPWRILDAGGGQGQMSVYFAGRGHNVVLCDISREMLDLAERNLAQYDVNHAVELRHAAIQDVAREQKQTFDLVVCHAVLEWVADPRRLLTQLALSLKPGGVLSLLYYNLNGLVYKNLLRTNFKKVKQRQWQGHRGSLTPSTPLQPHQIFTWLNDSSMQVMCESGIRVFYDYIFNEEDRRRDPDAIIDMELRHSRVMPYKHLGRYIHLLCQKPARARR
ncbi:MAG: methyltransferase domain-containing protein [Cellvibrionaceae bacterium]